MDSNHLLFLIHKNDWAKKHSSKMWQRWYLKYCVSVSVNNLMKSVEPVINSVRHSWKNRCDKCIKASYIFFWKDCCVVGKVADSNTRDPQFDVSVRQFYENIVWKAKQPHNKWFLLKCSKSEICWRIWWRFNSQLKKSDRKQ